jgi:hypothetical protein
MLDKVRPSQTYADVSQLVTQRVLVDTQKKLEVAERKQHASKKEPLAPFDIHNGPGTWSALIAMFIMVTLVISERRTMIQECKTILADPQSTLKRSTARHLKSATSFLGRSIFGMNILAKGIVPGMGVGVFVNGITDIIEEEQRHRHSNKQNRQKIEVNA